MTDDLSRVVAHSADTADLHAPVPTLLLELQTLLGTLSGAVEGTVGDWFEPGQ